MKKVGTFNSVRTALLFAFILVLANSLTAQSAAPARETNAAPSNPQTVNAQQAGAWTVGIDPARNTVQLANSEANPLPVKVAPNGPARKPFQKRIVVTMQAGRNLGATTISLPTAKRLVIENVSAVARFPEGLRAFMHMITYADDGNGVPFDDSDISHHRLTLVDQMILNGQVTSTANHKVLVFADQRIGNVGGGTLGVWFTTNGNVAQQTTAEVTLTGYIEDLPTGQ